MTTMTWLRSSTADARRLADAEPAPRFARNVNGIDGTGPERARQRRADGAPDEPYDSQGPPALDRRSASGSLRPRAARAPGRQRPRDGPSEEGKVSLPVLRRQKRSQSCHVFCDLTLRPQG